MNKIDRRTVNYVPIGFSSIIFILAWVFNVNYVIISILVLIGIVTLSLFGFMKQLIQDSLSSVFLSYLGISFIALSRFKAEISTWNADINMISVGIALVGLAVALSFQRKEQKDKKIESLESTNSDSTDPLEPRDMPSIDIVLDEARRTLDFQFEQLDGLNTKSGIILGIAGVVITLLVSALIGMPEISSSLIVKIIGSFIVVTLLISVFLSYRNLRIVKWNKPPELDFLIKEYVFKDSDTTKGKVIGTMQKAINENEKLYQERLYLYKCSYVMLFAGLLIVAISVITLLFI